MSEVQQVGSVGQVQERKGSPVSTGGKEPEVVTKPVIKPDSFEGTKAQVKAEKPEAEDFGVPVKQDPFAEYTENSVYGETIGASLKKRETSAVLKLSQVIIEREPKLTRSGYKVLEHEHFGLSDWTRVVQGVVLVGETDDGAYKVTHVPPQGEAKTQVVQDFSEIDMDKLGMSKSPSNDRRVKKATGYVVLPE